MNYIAYLGNKSRYSGLIIDSLNGRFNKLFVEPFGGSGAVSLEVALHARAFINEIDVNVFMIHHAFKHGTYETLDSILRELWSKGDPINDRQTYYAIRTQMNESYFGSGTIEEGFYNWAITKFAINSMARFGPNGYNQGWGNRGVTLRDMPRHRFEGIKKRYENIELSNQDFFTMELPSGILFVDPPYVTMESGTYSFTERQYDAFIEKIKAWPDEVVYTDVFSEETLERLGEGWSFSLLRDNMGYASVEKDKRKKRSEAMYTNFKRKNALW